MIYNLPPKYIVFESAPDLSDNTKAVFDEMLARGWNRRYLFVWLLYNNHPSDYPKNPRIRYYSDQRSFGFRIAMARAKCVICCNRCISTSNKKTKHYFLNHGAPLKNVQNYYHLPEEFDYCFCNSRWFEQGQMETLHIQDKNKMVSLGFPRNDVLSLPPMDLHGVFGKEYQKIVAWYPTFRQHKSGKVTGSTNALPIIWDENRAIELNECAKANKVLIVLKPHFAQDVSKIKSLSLSNIVFINDEFFKDNGITSYRFIGSCDALLTDYSSIYYDYTLCDKPIGLIWEDYEEYKRNPGFAVDMDDMMKGGVKIYRLEELKAFIHDVADETDALREERREIRDRVNYSADGKNAERVVDFIVQTAQLEK